MAVVRFSKLNLPNPSLSPLSPRVSSLLFEPISSSLALTLSDSSISLYPSLSPISSPSLSYPQTLIPSPCSSATFLLLRSQNPSCDDDSGNGSSPRVLFVVAGPYRGGSRVLLRFYALREGNKGFVRAQVLCDQKGMEFDRKIGVLLNLSHGVSVRITGSVNYFIMYSASSSKVLVFGVKLTNDGDGAVVVKLIRCAVIECSRPVWSIGIFSGVLLLGEENGVRVLNLRELVKGKVKKVKNNGKSEGKRLHAANTNTGDGRSVLGNSCNGYLEGKKEKHALHVKQRLSKHRQETSEASMCFVSFANKPADSDAKSKICPLMSVKAVSIQALSPKRFLILDSAGYIHVLHVSGPPIGSNFACRIGQLPHFMEVQKLAVLPETSVGMRNFWISDGDYSVYMVTACDEDTAVKEEAEDTSDKAPMQVSVKQAIFAPEKIQDIVPLGGDGTLILGLVISSPGDMGFNVLQLDEVTSRCLQGNTQPPETIATNWWLVCCGLNQHFSQLGSCFASSTSCASRLSSCALGAVLRSRVRTTLDLIAGGTRNAICCDFRSLSDVFDRSRSNGTISH